MRLLATALAFLAAAPAWAAPSESLYQLGGRYTDQHGEAVQLGDTRGHPTLITLFYGSCPQACPLLISKMKLLERSLPAAEREDLRVTLVSLDPARDTPQALERLAAAHGVDQHRWRLLRTTPAEVEVLAAALGIRFHRLNNGAIWHASVIVVLDREGRIAGRVEGLGLELAPLEKLLAGQAG